MKLFKTSVPQRSHQLFAIQGRTHCQVLFFLFPTPASEKTRELSGEGRISENGVAGKQFRQGLGKDEVYAGKMLDIIGQGKALGRMGQ